MVDPVDKICVVRQHRWLAVDAQADRMKGRSRVTVSLGGGKVQQVDRDGLVKLCRPGAVVELVHAFLLADPRQKNRPGGLQADFRRALALIERRGATVKDLDGAVGSGRQRKALLALVDKDIGRSNRGAKSAANGARSRGRPMAEFSAQQRKEAKAIWRNVKDFPTWEDAQKAFDAEVDGFTTARAFKLWRGRT